tara:strand:- start:942 stop:1121 length:180 start_codon:yes stop_codon:yes gene_type:complete
MPCASEKSDRQGVHLRAESGNAPDLLARQLAPGLPQQLLEIDDIRLKEGQRSRRQKISK